MLDVESVFRPRALVPMLNERGMFVSEERHFAHRRFIDPVLTSRWMLWLGVRAYSRALNRIGLAAAGYRCPPCGCPVCKDGEPQSMRTARLRAPEWYLR